MAPEDAFGEFARRARIAGAAALVVCFRVAASAAADFSQARRDATVSIGPGCYGTYISDAGHILAPAHCLLGETSVDELQNISQAVEAKQGWLVEAPIKEHDGKDIEVNGAPARLFYSGRIAAKPPPLNADSEDRTRVHPRVYARGITEDWVIFQMSVRGKPKCLNASVDGPAYDKPVCAIDDGDTPRCATSANWDTRWIGPEDFEGHRPYAGSGGLYIELVREGAVYFPKAAALTNVIGAGLSDDDARLRAMVVRGDRKFRIAWAVPVGRIRGALVMGGVDTDPLFACSFGLVRGPTP